MTALHNISLFDLIFFKLVDSADESKPIESLGPGIIEDELEDGFEIEDERLELERFGFMASDSFTVSSKSLAWRSLESLGKEGLGLILLRKF